MTGASARRSVERKLHREVSAIFADPLPVAGQAIPVFVKCGIAMLESRSRCGRGRCRMRKLPCTRRKTSGVRHLRHHPEMNSEMAQRLALEHRLRGALDQDQFRLFYQPQVERGTGRVIGAEALIRWVDPEHGIVPPACSCRCSRPPASSCRSESGCCRRAAEDCRRWLRHGLGPLRMAVNVSPVQLNRPDFAERFSR